MMKANEDDDRVSAVKTPKLSGEVSVIVLVVMKEERSHKRAEIQYIYPSAKAKSGARGKTCQPCKAHFSLSARLGNSVDRLRGARKFFEAYLSSLRVGSTWISMCPALCHPAFSETRLESI